MYLRFELVLIPSLYGAEREIPMRNCWDHRAEALDWTRKVMTRIGLTLNEAKTSIKQARRERFDFLGYSFGPHRLRKNVMSISGPVRRRRALAGCGRK